MMSDFKKYLTEINVKICMQLFYENKYNYVVYGRFN